MSGSSSLRVVLVAALLACGGNETTTATKTAPPTPRAPTITAVQPSTIAATNLPQTITIVGSGFDSAPAVILSPPTGPDVPLSGSQLSNAGSTSISTNVVLGAAGAWRAQVKNRDGQSSTALAFTVNPAVAPVVQSISPSMIGLVGEQRVTFTGLGFQRGLAVVVTDPDKAAFAVEGASIESLTPTSFVMKILVGAQVELGLVVVNPDGQASGDPIRLTVGPPIVAPVVTSISPTPIEASTFEQSLLISGSGFESSVAAIATAPDGVRQAYATLVEPPTSTSARFLVTLDVPGTWTLTFINVVNGAGLGRVTSPLVVGPVNPNRPPRPAITGLSPSTLALDDAEQIVTIQGSGFQPGLKVNMPSAFDVPFLGRVVSVTPTAIQLAVSQVRPGSWQLSVRNPDFLTSNAMSFSVSFPTGPDPIPVLSAAPLAVTTSLTDQKITLTGTAFRPSARTAITRPQADLDVNTSISASLAYLNSKTLELRARFDRAGTWRVAVASNTGTSNEIDVVASYPNSSPPTITSLDPPLPFANPIAQQRIRVQGTSFQPGLRVLVVGDDSVRGYSPDFVTVDSVTPTSLRFTALLRTTGRLQVQNPDGRVSNIYRFATQTPPPSIGSTVFPTVISPNPQQVSLGVGNKQSGIAVVLTTPSGIVRSVSNLANSTSPVTFDAVIDVPGLWRVKVVNPDGKESNQVSFSVFAVPAPIITEVQPVVAHASHDSQTLTVRGTNFVTGLTIVVQPTGNVSLPAMTFLGDQIANLTPTSLQVSPTLFAGSFASIAVVNPDGQRASRTIVIDGSAAPPALTGVTSTGLTRNKPQVITVAGANLHPGLIGYLTAPSGRTEAIRGALNVTASSFQLYVTFDQAGSWSLYVLGVDNQRSNVVSFTVQ